MIDLFGGSGAVFLEYLKRGECQCVYNDIFKPVCEIVKTISEGMQNTKILVYNAKKELVKSNEELAILQDKFKKALELGESSAPYFLALSSCCMRGMITSKLVAKRKTKTGEYKTELRPIRDLTQYCEYFEERDYLILNEDYKKVLERYKDDENAFIYCDPPYLSRKTSNDNYLKLDDNYILYLAECMKTYKCKIMLNVDFTGYNYNLLKDFIKHNYEKKYGVRKKTITIKRIT